jgi:hypothetical protein
MDVCHLILDGNRALPLIETTPILDMFAELGARVCRWELRDSQPPNRRRIGKRWRVPDDRRGHARIPARP